MKFAKISSVVLALLFADSQAIRVTNPDHTTALKGILRTLAGENTAPAAAAAAPAAASCGCNGGCPACAAATAARAGPAAAGAPVVSTK